MFLVNSRFPLVSAAPIPSGQRVSIKVGAPLLPKLRGHFAEFLNHNSLDRLSILYLITCVGLGYGRLKPRFHIRPINPVVWLGASHTQGVWKSHLEASFPLRCFQRLSHPNVANQRCTWQYN